MKNNYFKGYLTALITPFKNQKLDEASLEKLINWQISQNIQGLVLCGTTAESPTLSDEERKTIIDLALQCNSKKIPIVVGTGTNSTQSTIQKTLYAQDKGADAALIIVPYYNKPTQEGLYQHYKAIHDATKIPIILYSAPGRTITDFSFDTLLKLSKLERIIGIKDASGDLVRPLKSSLFIDSSFLYFTGNDDTALPYFVQGGQGCISVTSNVAPQHCLALYEAFKNKDIDKACKLNKELQPLNEALFVETNPGPVKYAVSLLGLCAHEVRGPLALVQEATQQKIKNALKQLKLI
jgi:4-hydroxy-tetrahydrodipicolinate synthase